MRVDAYPLSKGKPVLDLKAEEFEVFEDGVAQKVESFEFVQVRAAGAEEFRREPNTVREAQAMAAADRARIFVIYLDTYFTDLAASHRIQRSLVNMLNRVVGDDDLFAVMTPDMSASDLALARRTTTIEGYLSKYWFWGQRGRLYPEDPVEQRYLECYPERSSGSSCTTPGQNQPQKDPDNFYAGIAKEMIQRRREKQVIDGSDRSRALSRRSSRRAQGRDHHFKRLAALRAQPGAHTQVDLRSATRPVATGDDTGRAPDAGQDAQRLRILAIRLRYGPADAGQSQPVS